MTTTTAEVLIARPRATSASWDTASQGFGAILDQRPGSSRVATIHCRLFAALVLALPVVAQPQWRVEGGPPLIWAAVAYDEARAELVTFSRDNTWIHDGNRWQRRATPAQLLGRNGAALAYDAARQRTVLFGGTVANGVAGDTWEWDGATWTFVRSDPQLAGSQNLMVFDRARGRCVRFGTGPTAGYFLSEWDGSAWTPISPQLPAMLSLGYDEANNRLVAHDNLQLYHFNGTGWSPVPNAYLPWNGNSNTVLAYDRARQQLMLAVGTPQTVLMYDWTGFSFVLNSPTAGPPARNQFQPVYDSSRQCLLIACGYDSNHYVMRSDLWEWNGLQWRLRDASPPIRTVLGPSFSNVTVDTSRSRIVLFAGATAVFSPAVWEWDSHQWHEISVPQILPRGPGGPLAYDSLRQRVVMVAARLGSTLQTWTYDGVNFTPLVTAHSPPDRVGSDMAYDAARDRMLLYGNGATNDTWLFDGVDWQQAFPATSPPVNTGHKLVYDPVHQETVMFTIGAQTWIWDGADWQQRNPSLAPSTRIGFGMTWDATRQRVALCGGADPYIQPSGYPLRPAELFEWDGTNWSRRQTTGLEPLLSLSMAYAFDSLILYGGGTATTPGDLMLRLIDAPVANAIAFGHGCTGSAGEPLLRADFAPFLGHTAFGLRVTSAPASAPVVLAVDFAAAAAPLGGGCTQYLQSPILLQFAASDAGGAARFPLPVPQLPILLGLHLFAQGVVVDANGALGGVSLTAGMDLLLGN